MTAAAAAASVVFAPAVRRPLASLVRRRFYEAEVTLDDGSQVDVQLDQDFNVVGATADGEDSADTDTSSET